MKNPPAPSQFSVRGISDRKISQEATPQSLRKIATLKKKAEKNTLHTAVFLIPLLHLMVLLMASTEERVLHPSRPA